MDIHAAAWSLEAGGCRLGAGGWGLEAGGWRLEAGGWGLGAGGWRLGAGGWRPLPFDFGGGFWGRLLGAAFGGGFWGRPAAFLLPPACRLLAIILLDAGCWLLAAGWASFVRWAALAIRPPPAPPLRCAPLRWLVTLV